MTNPDDTHVALPLLYGAPAYARPPVAVAHTMRPLDPDDLPIEAQQTTTEREIVRELTGRAYAGPAPSEPMPAPEGGAGLRPRPFRLRAIAARLRGEGPRA